MGAAGAKEAVVFNKWLRAGYAWACERLYHEFAWSYDWVSWGVSGGAWHSWRRVALDEVHQQEATTGAPVLELGFGTGALLAAAAQRGISCVGLELSPQMHAVAMARLKAHGVCAPRVRATALQMPFAGGSFGAVIATFPAPYIVAPATLRECHRVLRARGRLIIGGLWVAPAVAGHRLHLPLLYGAPASAQVDAVLQRIEGAGFTATLQMRRARGAEVAVVVGQKAPINTEEGKHAE
jgi:SAM-dependent methyltransferase